MTCTKFDFDFFFFFTPDKRPEFLSEYNFSILLFAGLAVVISLKILISEKALQFNITNIDTGFLSFKRKTLPASVTSQSLIACPKNSGIAVTDFLQVYSHVSKQGGLIPSIFPGYSVKNALGGGVFSVRFLFLVVSKFCCFILKQCILSQLTGCPVSMCLLY